MCKRCDFYLSLQNTRWHCKEYWLSINSIHDTLTDRRSVTDVTWHVGWHVGVGVSLTSHGLPVHIWITWQYTTAADNSASYWDISRLSSSTLHTVQCCTLQLTLDIFIGTATTLVNTDIMSNDDITSLHCSWQYTDVSVWLGGSHKHTRVTRELCITSLASHWCVHVYTASPHYYLATGTCNCQCNIPAQCHHVCSQSISLHHRVSANQSTLSPLTINVILFPCSFTSEWNLVPCGFFPSSPGTGSSVDTDSVSVWTRSAFAVNRRNWGRWSRHTNRPPVDNITPPTWNELS